MRQIMHRAIVVCVVVIFGGVLASGCASKDKKNRDGTRDDSTRTGHTPDAFETGGDPPFNANTRFAAGQLAESQNQFDKAIQQYREALKLEPQRRDAQFNVAALLTRQRHFPEAVEEWQKYIEITNHAPEAYNDLALCYEGAGQIDKAEETYRASIARMPADPVCRNSYGLMLARQNRLSDAVAQLSVVRKPAEVSYNLGRVFEEQGKVEQAKAYYQEALKQDPTLRDAQARLALLK
jgi:tetratricopeptide (TPR) repeat protein